MKGYFICLWGLVFGLIFPVHLMALTPLPLRWHTILSKNSSVVLNGGTDAIFKIKNAREEDLASKGYAYILSDPIPLPANWSKVIIYGQWWQNTSFRDNCEEMSLVIHAGQNDQLNESDSSYIKIGYDNWQAAIQFIDKGMESENYEQTETPRDIPSRPTEFRLEIERNRTPGFVGWSFYEKSESGWEELFSNEKANFLKGDGATELLWKIGGRANGEGHAFCKLHFRRLGYQVRQIQDKDSSSLDAFGRDKDSKSEEDLYESKPDESIEGPFCNQKRDSKKVKVPLSCSKIAASLDYKTLIPYADGVTIPISGGCRGACGGKCPDQCQDMPDRAVLISGPDNTCYYLVYYRQVKRCGSHIGCRYHDSCFDYCKEVKKELGTLKEIRPCHDYCSGIVVKVFGARMGSSWMVGNGPYDDKLIFFDSTKDNPKVMGPFDPSSMSPDTLKSMGIIDQNTEIFRVSDIPPIPQKTLYAIEVWTGNVAGAGTDSPIAITLFDSNGHSSGEMVLPPSPFPVVPKMPSDILFPSPDDWILLSGELGQLTSNPYIFFNAGVRKQNWWAYRGLERGSHETYYFLLGNYVDNISYIRLRRLNREPEEWRVVQKIGEKVQNVASSIKEKAKSQSKKIVKKLKDTGSHIGDAYFKTASKVGDKLKQVGSSVLHESSELIKKTEGVSFGNRNYTDWYCKRLRVFQERWNSFAVSRLLGEFEIESWITEKGKNFSNGIWSSDNSDNFSNDSYGFLIYTYDNLGKRLLAIDPFTGRAQVVNHGFIPVTVGDLSPAPSGDTLLALGLKVPDVAIFTMNVKTGDVSRLASTNLKFGEAVEYDPVGEFIVGSGRDRVPGTYDSYLFLKFNSETGSIVTAVTSNIRDIDSIARNPFSGKFYAVDNQPGRGVSLWQLDPETGKGGLIKYWNKNELFGFDGMIGIAFIAPDVACGLLHKGGHVPLDEYRLVHINMKDFSICLLPEQNLGIKAGLHLSAPAAMSVCY